MTRTLLVLAGCLTSFTAQASTCQALVDSVASQPREKVAGHFTKLVACDRALAESRFDDFMRASGDVPSLTNLALAAIAQDLFNPVWSLLDKIPDYTARDEVSRAIGGRCEADAKVMSFLQGAYFSIGDRQFSQWGEGLATCNSGALTTWMATQVGTPPKASFDKKYAVLVADYVRRTKKDALPVLESAAKLAGTQGGPLADLVDQMSVALKPEGFGASLGEAEKATLAQALLRVAADFGPDPARTVGEELYQMGREADAASLLKRVYPDRLQADGSALYGVVAVEACDGGSWVHWATVAEPAKRWTVIDEVTTLARAFPPKLKCTAEEPWLVVISPEPLADKAAVTAWATQQVGSLAAGAKLKEEKAITLP